MISPRSGRYPTSGETASPRDFSRNRARDRPTAHQTREELRSGRDKPMRNEEKLAELRRQAEQTILEMDAALEQVRSLQDLPILVSREHLEEELASMVPSDAPILPAY